MSPIFSAIYEPRNGLLNTFLRSVGLDSLTRNWLTDPNTAMNCIIVMSLWSGVGMTMLLYLTGMQSLQKEYYEAAIVDGANYFQKLTRITIPMIMPSITINVVLSLINGLKVFGEVYALTNGGPNNATEVFGTLIFKNFGKGFLGYSAAVSLVFTFVVGIFVFVLVKLMRKLEVEL